MVLPLRKANFSYRRLPTNKLFYYDHCGSDVVWRHNQWGVDPLRVVTLSVIDLLRRRKVILSNGLGIADQLLLHARVGNAFWVNNNHTVHEDNYTVQAGTEKEQPI